MRAAGYVRVSTEEQASKGTSPEFQRDRISKWAELHDAEVEFFEDLGLTGKHGDRPGLNELRRRLSEFDTMVVYRMDRLARNLRLLLEIKEALEDQNVAFVSITESIDTSSPMGRGMFGMTGVFAEMERGLIIDRTRAGRQTRYQNNQWASGTVPFGYDYDKSTKRLVVNDAEASVVRSIFNKYVYEHLSMRKLGQHLTDAGVRPRHSARAWHDSAIRQILTRRAYIGQLEVNRKNRDPRDRADSYIEVPRIIDDGLWRLAEKRRASNHRIPSPRSERGLLSGKMRCGEDGHVLRYEAPQNTIHRGYSCPRRHEPTNRGTDSRCTLPRFKADVIEGQVWERIDRIMGDPDYLGQLLQSTVDRLRVQEDELRQAVMPIDEQLERVQGQRERLGELYEMGEINQEKFKARVREYAVQVEDLQRQRRATDPEKLSRLVEIQGKLGLWRNLMEGLRDDDQWVTEDEDGLTDSQRLTIRLARKLVSFEDSSMDQPFPTSRKQLLDFLQIEVVAYHDRVEVNAIFPIEPVVPEVSSSAHRRAWRESDRRPSSSCQPWYALLRDQHATVRSSKSSWR